MDGQLGTAATAAYRDHLERPALALFDLDRTLVPGSSLVHLARVLRRRRELPGLKTVRLVASNARFAGRGSTDGLADGLRQRMLFAVAGRARDPLVAAIDEAADAAAATVYPAACLLLEHHLARGDRCVLVSAGPQELVEAIAARVGAHRGVGTRSEVVDGLYTGRLDGPFCYRAGKLARLRDELGPLDLGRAYAYSDSDSDLPLLQACGHPVATNPDRRLEAVARRAGWPILRFS